MCKVGRPPTVELLDRAMEIQAMADEMRRQAKAQLAQERAAAEERAAVQMAHDLAVVTQRVWWKTAGRLERRRVVPA